MVESAAIRVLKGMDDKNEEAQENDNPTEATNPTSLETEINHNLHNQEDENSSSGSHTGRPIYPAPQPTSTIPTDRTVTLRMVDTVMPRRKTNQRK